MKGIITKSLGVFISTLIVSQQVSAYEVIPTIEPTEHSIQFFKKQVSSGSSLSSTMKSLLDRYPQRTTEFVAIALSAYPNNYKEIISASVTSQPMFIDEIIMVANDYKVARPTEIVSIVINAEPSYASAAASAACKYSPQYFNEIIKAAVTTEPDSADQIAQRLVKAYPSKTMEILITTIKEVPLVGKYVLDALLATVDEAEIKSEDMIVISVEQLAQYPDAIERLVELAEEHQISADKIRVSAVKGGLSDKAIVAIINQHYDVKVR